jgi:antitoxin VapB
MAKAKVFKSGNSQAVRLPKDFRFDQDEVEIERRGEEIVLRSRRENLGELFEILTNLSDDFLKDGRKQPVIQHRKDL